MDDLFLVIIIALSGLVSYFVKAQKRQQEQAGRSQEAPPKWPGPVAGPRPGQGPTWAPAPAPRPASPKPPTAWAPKPPPEPKQESPKPAEQRTLVSGDVFTRSLDMEGYGTEGIGSEGLGVEGPGVGEGVEDELNRFSRETELLEQRHLAEMHGRLGGAGQKAAVVTADAGTSAELQAALGDTASLSRAIVLAEVLGKPKALRPRGFRRV